MTQTLRNNIASSLSSGMIGGNTNNSTPFMFKVGKVIDVLMDDATPNSTLFSKDGSWAGIGTVYYVDYVSLKETNESTSSVDLLSLNTALPLFPEKKSIPVKEELVLIVTLPSKDAQNSTRGDTQDYYISTINIYNNNNHNSQPAGEKNLGRNFEENNFVKYVLPFEGDIIYESRFGSSLHFSSTTSWNQTENWWSKNGDNGSPITFLTNGYYIDPKSDRPHVEDLKRDASSLILTSTQYIPYLSSINKFSTNSIFTPLANYTNSQAILIADRITLDAKKDEILLYSNQLGALSNISIYLESKGDITLNAPIINLGMSSNGKVPVEPVLLGDKTSEIFIDLLIMLQDLSERLSTSLSTTPGTPLMSVNEAGNKLLLDINNIITKYNSDKKITSGFDKLKSNNVYTI